MQENEIGLQLVREKCLNILFTIPYDQDLILLVFYLITREKQ